MTSPLGTEPSNPEAEGVLFESVNPFGTFVAVMEDDGHAVYLYVFPTEQRDAPARALWMANRRPAPSQESGARDRRPPQMPENHVMHPEGTAAYKREDLEVVWLEDGAGVAVWHRGTLLALLPSPSPENTAPGFSREAVGRGPWAWSLLDEAALPWVDAAQAARGHWPLWSGANTPWPRLRDGALARLGERLGPHAEYFAALGDRFPPLGIARFPLAREVQNPSAPQRMPESTESSSKPGAIVCLDNLHLYVTVGMSCFPMPGAPPTSLGSNGHGPAHRAEIALLAEGTPSWATQTLAWLARYPWTFATWLGDRHLVRAPAAHATWFPPDASALLLLRAPAGAKALGIPSLEDETVAPESSVAYLFALPVTMDEQRAILAGTTDQIVQRVATRTWRTLP